MSDDEFADFGDINEGEKPLVLKSSVTKSIFQRSEGKHSLSYKKVENDNINLKENSKVITNDKNTHNPSVSFQITKDLPSNDQQFSNSEITPTKPKKTVEEPLLFNDEKTTKSLGKAHRNLLKDFCFSTPKITTIPILNKDTTHPDTFDINYTLSPSIQKIAKSGHRLTQSVTISNLSLSKTEKKNSVKNSRKTEKNEFSRKSSFNVDERFYHKAKKTEEKIKILKSAKEQEEIGSCTFRPHISSNRKHKSYQEFYEYMNSFNQKKEKKVESLREEKQKAFEFCPDFTYQPKINQKSVKILEKKGNSDEKIHERLTKSLKIQEKFLNPEKDDPKLLKKLFHPTVSKKSQLIQRSESIEKILYKDAIKRFTSTSVLIPEQLSTRLISLNSEKILIEKLKKDFQDSFSSLDIDNTGQINYSKTVELFWKLNLIKENEKSEQERIFLLEIWKTLVKDPQVYCGKDSIFGIVLAIMGFYEELTKNPERFALTLNGAKKIHSKYELFYRNRLSKKNFYSKNKTIDDYSYHPQITSFNNKSAEALKTLNRPNDKIEDLLIAEKAKVQTKIAKIRTAREEKIMEECTFQPFIQEMPEEFKSPRLEDKQDLSSEYFKLKKDLQFEKIHKGVFLHDLSKIYKEKKVLISQNMKEQQKQKELEVCSFTPKTDTRIFEKSKKFFTPKPKILKKKSSNTPNFIQIAKKRLINKNKINSNLDSFEVISTENGISKIAVKTKKVSEILDFDSKTDDPTNKVLAFSSKFSLQKDEEYKLVEQLTLLKYQNN